MVTHIGTARHILQPNPLELLRQLPVVNSSLEALTRLIRIV